LVVPQFLYLPYDFPEPSSRLEDTKAGTCPQQGIGREAQGYAARNPLAPGAGVYLCGAVCKQAGIEGFTFHDLRHTAINNWRLQGHDYFRIMAASGHKTMSVFKRYNTVSEAELRALVGGETSA
jgi:integrase